MPRQTGITSIPAEPTETGDSPGPTPSSDCVLELTCVPSFWKRLPSRPDPVLDPGALPSTVFTTLCRLYSTRAA